MGEAAGAQTVPSSISNSADSATNPADAPPVAPSIVDRGVPAPGNQTAGGYGALSGYLTNTVNGRARPGFDPLGLPVGSFRLYPTLTVSGFYDSNVYALPSGVRSGVGAIIAPQASLVSDWSRHALSVSVDSAFDLYSGNSNSNSETVSGTANGRLDVDSSTQLFSTVSLGRKVEPRGSEYGAAFVSSPIFYREASATANAQHRFGDLLVNIGGSYVQDRFEAIDVGGTRVSLSDNNSETAGANARVQYTVGPGIGFFVSASYNDLTLAQTPLVPNRNSSGYSVLGGVAFGVTRLLTGEVGIGYLHQGFAYAGYGNVNGIDYSLKLDWSPTQLLDVHANFGRSFQQTVIVNSGGIQLDSLTASIDYELKRNVLLTVGGGFVKYDYRGINLGVQEYDNNYSVRYLLNRHLSLVGNVTLTRQRPDADSQFSRGFDRAVVTFGVRIQQ